MTYRVQINRAAEKDMGKLSDAMLQRIKRGIESLGVDPHQRGVKKLRSGGFRLAVGHYRVIFDIDGAEKLVIVSKVRHRREAYR